MVLERGLVTSYFKTAHIYTWTGQWRQLCMSCGVDLMLDILISHVLTNCLSWSVEENALFLSVNWSIKMSRKVTKSAQLRLRLKIYIYIWIFIVNHCWVLSLDMYGSSSTVHLVYNRAIMVQVQDSSFWSWRRSSSRAFDMSASRRNTWEWYRNTWVAD